MTSLLVSRTPLLVLGAAVLACSGERGGKETPSPLSERTNTVRDSIRVRREGRMRTRPDTLGARADSARIVGSPSARVWLVVTSDFQCPACRDFAERVMPSVRLLADSGLVRLAFINAPSGDRFNARFASLAALCAGLSGKFWAVHDSLFATQHIWDRNPDPRPYFDSLAVKAGANRATQEECTGRDRMLPLLNRDLERSNATVTGELPAVFVGDYRLGPRELNTRGIRLAVEKALQR